MFLKKRRLRREKQLYTIIEKTAAKHNLKSQTYDTICRYNFEGKAGALAIKMAVPREHLKIEKKSFVEPGITNVSRRQLMVHIDFSGILKGNIRISKETDSSLYEKQLGLGDMLTGDDYFDNKLFILADFPMHLSAYLDQNSREMLITLSAYFDKIDIHAEGMTFIKKTRKMQLLDNLDKEIANAISLAQNLTGKKSLPKRLIEIIKQDPEKKVHNLCESRLLQHFPGHPAVCSYLRPRLKNANTWQQVEAARYMGNEGMDHLVKIISNKQNINKNYALVLRAIDILTKSSYSKAVGPAKAICRNADNYELNKAALKLLLAAGTRNLAGFFLEQLETEKHADILDLVIEGLAQWGGIAAVEKLILLSKKFPWFSTKKKAETAIDEIQSRLGNVKSGWLSISETAPMQGALSNEGAPKGALSKIKKKSIKKRPKV